MVACLELETLQRGRYGRRQGGRHGGIVLIIMLLQLNCGRRCLLVVGHLHDEEQSRGVVHQHGKQEEGCSEKLEVTDHRMCQSKHELHVQRHVERRESQTEKQYSGV